MFKILDNKSGFISKEKEIDFITEKDNISLDYQNIATYVPMVTAIYRTTKEDTPRIAMAVASTSFDWKWASQ